MTLTAYAQRRGVSVKAVSKAVAAGRLAGSVVRDKHGNPKIGDPDLADREWTANTRTSIDRAPDGPAPPAPASPPIAPPPATGTDDVPDYHAARARREAAAARREAALADMAEIDLAERRGELVPAEQARSDVEARFTIVRTKLLGVPSRVAQRLPPDLRAQAVPLMDEFIREALEELADLDEEPADEVDDGAPE